MLPRLAASCVMVALVTAGLTAQDLPTQQSDDDSFEVEPPLLIPNRGNEPLPAVTADGKATVIDPDRLEKDLERAKRNAGGADRLYKMGVLAKVEVEQRALRVVRLQSELENARMALAKEEILRQEQRLAAGEISKADLSATEVALARAIEAAHAAAANREKAELEAAELNLRRQRKLFELGSGHKSDVARAEKKLAELKASKN